MHTPQWCTAILYKIGMIGQTMAGYQIQKLINEGGMGAVYYAQHSNTGKKAAVKVLKPHLVSQGSFKQRFQNEAKLMSNLHHPNLVSLYHYEENSKGLFLVMEYVDGKSLKEILQQERRPLPPREALALFTQILDAFGYAHKQKLVHRDVKPDNILLDKNGQVKVLDFGIAKALDGDDGLTSTGVQMGTLKYMSPEQVHDAKYINHLSDIYSLGITLYYLLANSNPYDRMESRLDVQISIAKDPLPNLKLINPVVPDSVIQAIRIATSKQPEKRFQSCAEFKAALMYASAKAVIPTTSSIKIDADDVTLISPSTTNSANSFATPNTNNNASKDLEALKHKMQEQKVSTNSVPKQQMPSQNLEALKHKTSSKTKTSKLKIAGIVLGIVLVVSVVWLNLSPEMQHIPMSKMVQAETIYYADGKYLSYNYYGNGVTEYITLEGENIYYTSSVRGESGKVPAQNVVLKTNTLNYVEYEMYFDFGQSSDTGTYKFVIIANKLTITNPQGNTQKYVKI